MMYCTACKLAHEGRECPRCGRKKSREVQPEDPCEALYVREPMASMAQEMLKQAGIPTFVEGELGGFFTAYFGAYGRGPVSVCVPYAALNEAREVLAAAFPEVAEDASEDSPDKDAN